MRIAVIGTGTRSVTLPPHLAGLAHAPVTALLVNPRLSAFALTPYERLVVDLGYVDAMQQAADAGCESILINSFADYGIDAARAAVGMPVVGAGEAAIVAASAHGTRDFAIVTVWPASMAFLYAERLRNVPGGERCVAIRHVSTEAELQRLGSRDGVMERMVRHDAAVIDALLRECEAAVREHGAAAIALGCTCMAPIGPELLARCRVPVYESSRAGFHAAVAAAQAHAALAPGSPGATGAVAPTAARCADATLVPAIVTAWADARPQAQPPAGDCPVCIDATEPDPTPHSVA
jgi:Asp/Glu/hydantoin racemase